MDPRLQKMAEVLVNYSVEVKPGQFVAISSPIAGEALAVQCVRATLKAGGHPWAQFESPEAHEIVYRNGNDDQIGFVPEPVKVMIERSDVYIAILAPTNTRALTSVAPDRMAIRNKAMGPLQETYMKRTASGEFKWTGCMFPTDAAAQDAGMSLSEYQDFVFGAGLIDTEDPVAEWRALSQRQQRIADWLADKSEVQITGPGTDLKLGVAARTWLNDDGHLNFPGGEVFTGPIEDSVEGEIQYNLPGFYAGREVSGIKLRFATGKVVDASAQTDEAFLHEMLALDEGAKRIGELAFGLNDGVQRFTKQTLFDEKIGGTTHMALGLSIPQTGGLNESTLHWDMVFDLRQGGEVRVDGQTFSRDGKILI